MDYIEIEGYKSIKKAKVDIKPINILIGSNGAGKSNFVSFFEFLNNLYERKLQEYIALNGGEDKILFRGIKITNKIKAKLSFNEEINAYSFILQRGDDGFVFVDEKLWFNNNPWDIADLGKEANVKNNKESWRAEYIRSYLKSYKKYHFHDTGKNSPFNQVSSIKNDIYFLYSRGENLAAYLYHIHEEHPVVYSRIVKLIQNIAPYFSDFYLQPNAEGYLRLLWQDKYSSTIYGATDLSDGTIRFIALTTLFMQPDLPQTLIIDEPELGLHPFAISKLAGLIQSVANKDSQVIVATQSTDLISYFNPDDIITVDQKDGESIFNRLNSEELAQWLDDYALGDLWKRNIIHRGQP